MKSFSQRYPKVSVAMPTYMHEQYIEESMLSVLQQDYPNIELVIGDDASTDKTPEIIKEYTKRYPNIIVPILSNVNTGITENCNRVFSACSGEYVAFFSGDDLFMPEKISKQIHWFSKNPDAVFNFTNVAVLDSEQNNVLRIVPDFNAIDNALSSIPLNIIDLSYHLGEAGISFMAKKSALPTDGFDTSMKYFSDWLYWIEIMSIGEIGYIAETLAVYRKHKQSFSTGGNQKNYVKMFNDHMRTLEIAEEKFPNLREYAIRRRWQILQSVPETYTEQIKRQIASHHYQIAESEIDTVNSVMEQESKEQEIKENNFLLLATSIAPFEIEKQQRAVQSWKQYGFSIISFNTSEEIVLLKEQFDDVQFIAVHSTAQSITGKPLVFLDSILDYFRASNYTLFGIINADIILQDNKNIQEFLQNEVRNCIVSASRVDVAHPEDSSGILYNSGFDVFFFDSNILEVYENSTFALGAPWWDYWMLHRALQKGKVVKKLCNPFAHHIAHNANYSEDLWLYYAQIFAEMSDMIDEISSKDPASGSLAINSNKLKKFGGLVLSKIQANSAIVENIAQNITNETKPTAFTVSAIVSAYKSEKFIRGCMENLVRQTLFQQGKLEIVVIDSASPENESELVNEYMNKYGNIQLIRTERREGIYTAWNRGILLSNGKYITNANTDDRHRADAFEIMANALDSFPNIGLVYADSFVSTIENETFENTSAQFRYSLPEFNLGTQLSSSCFGAQPMWRKEIHSTLGYFNSTITIAGDYDFFIRAAWKFKALHIQETLGLFLSRNDSASGNNNSQETVVQTLKALYYYRRAIPLQDIYPLLLEYGQDSLAHAAALWDMGNLCALSPYRDYELAIQYYDKALSVSGLPSDVLASLRSMYANNTAIVLWCSNHKEMAKKIINDVREFSASTENYSLMTKAEESGLILYPMHFKFAEILHPVVQSARLVSGVYLDFDRKFFWSDKKSQVFWDAYIGINGVPVSNSEKMNASKMWPRNYSETGSEHTDSAIIQIDDAAAKKQLKILVTMYGWNDEGGGTFLPRELVRALANQGFVVSVFYAAAQVKTDKPPYYIEKTVENNITLYGLYNRPTLFYDLQNPEREQCDENIRRIFSQILDLEAPNIIHFHNFFNLSMCIAEEAKTRNIPSVFSSHNFWFLCPRLYLLNNSGSVCSGPDKESFGKKCASCVGNSMKSEQYSRRLEYGKNILENVVSVHLTPSSRVQSLFLDNGFLGNNIRVLHQRTPIVDMLRNIRKEKKESFLPKKIIYLGSVLPIKGVHIAIQALQKISCQGITFHIYGSGPESYIHQLQKLDTKNICVFHGRFSHEQLPEILSTADIVVVPSLVEETGGLTAVEALAAGVPVISSNIGGLADTVVNDFNGFLFEAGNVAELSNIIDMICSDSRKYAAICNNAEIRDGFSDYLEQLIQLYRRLVSVDSI